MRGGGRHPPPVVVKGETWQEVREAIRAFLGDSDDRTPAAGNPLADPATSTSHPEFSDPLPAYLAANVP